MFDFLKNSKTRVLFFTLIIFLITGIFYFLFSYFAKDDLAIGGASLKKAPRVDATPWSSDSTQEYIRLQENQNVTKAKKAKSTGESAIPTIVRIESLEDGQFIIGGKESIGFRTLLEGGEVSEAQIILNSLSDTGCVIEDLKFALTQKITLSDLKVVCGCSKLKKAGVAFNKLNEVCDCKALKKAGFTSKMLKANGYTATMLRECDYSACELKAAGFTAKQMKDAGFTDLELKGAGFSQSAITAANNGLVEGIGNEDIINANCDPKKLNELRLKGIKVSKIREVSGCSIKSLKEAGYSLKELKNAGFTASELKNAGFNARQLQAVGFNPKELKEAGFTSKELKAAGFSLSDLKKAGFSAKELKDAGFTANALYKNGFTPKDLLEAGFKEKDLLNAGINKDIIKKAQAAIGDCSVQSIQNKLANKTPLKEIVSTYGCSLQNLIDAGITPEELLAIGFTMEDLKNAGIFYDFLKDGDCSKEFLTKARVQGISAQQIRKQLGCSAKSMQNVGYNLDNLKNAGFTAGELKDLGFSASDLKKAGYSASDLLKAGYDVKSLKEAGFEAAELLAAGASVKSLKNAGFSASDLKNAGVNASDLKKAGYSASDLKTAGFSVADLKNSGFSVKDLKDAGFNAKELLDAGYSVEELANIYGAKELLDAGISASDLLKAGVSVSDLKKAGLDAATLRQAGVSLDELLKNGFNSDELKDAGFSIAQIARAQARLRASDEFDFVNDSQIRDSIVDNKTKKLKLLSPKELQALQSQMSNYANALPRDWGVSDQQFIDGNEDNNAGVAGIPNNVFRNLNNLNQNQNIQQGQAQQPAANPANGTTPALFKAGDIQFAVLETSINSDEPGPILATITSGKLKGAKLVGVIEAPQNAQKAILRFNTLSIPALGNSIPISAVAIDINTARTGVSSKTDNHYISRYGSLFASSFLEGFGKALSPPTSTIDIAGGTVNVNQVKSTASEAALSSLGEVGKKWGETISESINRPPTIEIYAGVALGILLTQDLQLPE